MGSFSTSASTLTGTTPIYMYVIYIGAVLLGIAIIAAMWRAFTKAGKPGWAAIIPIYNIIVEIEVAGKPVWWILLFFVPLAQVIIPFIIAIEIAKRFGKSALWGFFLLGLFPIGWIILAFDDSVYSPDGNDQSNLQSPVDPPTSANVASSINQAPEPPAPEVVNQVSTDIPVEPANPAAPQVPSEPSTENPAVTENQTPQNPT